MVGKSDGALMRRQVRGWIWGTVVACLAVTLAACYPQLLVTQPALLLYIQNEAGEGVAARVTLYWWEYPHHRQRAVTVASTDARGVVSFVETTATEIMMPLMIHGMPAYNWSFCVEAESYKTLIGTVSGVEPGERVEVHLVLHRGEPARVCADYARLSHHPGAPVAEVDFSGGRVHGVYEVEIAQ
jgi:hypothetical protein